MMTDWADDSAERPVSASVVMEHVRGREDEIVDLVKELVRIETPSTDPSATAAGLRLVGDRLHQIGYRVTYRRPSSTGGWLVAMHPLVMDQEDIQLVVGHVDTVWPVGTLETMPLKVENGRIDGPGAFDMKSGLVQIVSALEVIRDLGVNPDIKPVVFVNTDEEIGSPSSTAALEKLSARATRALILEPPLGPNGALKTSRKGATRYNVVVRGRSAHAGLDPSAGSSAIALLADVLQQLFALNDAERGITVNVGMIEGGTRPNVIPASAKAVVDVRAPTSAGAEEIDRALMSIRVDPSAGSIEILRVGGRPPMEPTPGSRRLWYQATAAARELSIDLEEAMAGGASDGNTTSQFCPTIDGLGAVGDGAHAAHEHIVIERLLERTALLVLLLLAPEIQEPATTRA